MADEPKLSAVEKIKLQSNYLYGNLADELANDSDSFDKDTTHLVKHHGMYQQDDRDARVSKADEGKKSSRSYSLMVRVKVPGGTLRVTVPRGVGTSTLAPSTASARVTGTRTSK